MGGQALTAMSSLGYGQTWQTVTRTSGTTYYNTTGKPIVLAIFPAGVSNSGNISCVGIATANFSNNGLSTTSAQYSIIPINQSYVVTISAGSHTSSELR